MAEEKAQKEQIKEVIEELIEKGAYTYLKTVLIDLHPADIAETLARFNREDRAKVFDLLETEKEAEVLVELDGSVRQDVVSNLNEDQLVEIIGTMDSDDAADVIGELEENVAQQVLDAMPRKEVREVETLLRHDEETAGGIMALEIVAVDQNKTAQEALKVLRRKANEVEDVYNIYVVDTKGILEGIVTLKDLVLANPEAELNTIMDEEVVIIHPEMDQEEVANLFQKYDLVAAPVVDEKGRLVGRITVDDVLHVVEEEVSEDFTKMAGITVDEIGDRSIFRISGVRLPWLLVAFVGQMISAKVLNHYVPTTSQMVNDLVVATLFIPLIMAMAGNIGIQSSTVIIRGLATGDIRLRDTGRRLLQELSVALLNGLVIAILLSGVVTIWLHKIKLGSVLGLALLLVLFMAGFIGTIVPLILKRFRVDPAIATGPFITTANDVLGLIIYYSVVSTLGSV